MRLDPAALRGFLIELRSACNHASAKVDRKTLDPKPAVAAVPFRKVNDLILIHCLNKGGMVEDVVRQLQKERWIYCTNKLFWTSDAALARLPKPPSDGAL